MAKRDKSEEVVWQEALDIKDPSLLDEEEEEYKMVMIKRTKKADSRQDISVCCSHL